MQRKVDSRAMREVNRSIVLDLIRRGGRISRTDLARRSALTKPTVSAIVEDLIAAGIVQEVGFAKTLATGGRRARLLEFNEASAAYLGVRFGVHSTTVAVADARGEVRATSETSSIIGDPMRSIESVRQLIDEVLERAEIPRTRLQSLGVCVPGLVDAETGVCVLAPNIGWYEFPVRDAFADAFDLPVVVANVTNSAALAEGRIGAAKGTKSFIWVYVGTGIGAGIVLDGRVFYGGQGYSGEIGHCSVVENGALCGCGRRGCLETVASGMAVSRAAKTAIVAKEPTRLRDFQGPIDAAAVARAAREGDTVARRIFAEAGGYLGIGVSYLINILNPEMIVVGGGLVDAGEFLLEPLRASVGEHAIKAERVEITASVLGDRAAIVGTVLLAMDYSVRSYRIVSTTVAD
jgi:glucokinase-like ROK family protein